MVRYHLRFTGRVQGVGFRFTAQMNAEKCHVTGWVMNQMDGSVEAQAQGTSSQVEQFVDLMEHGHRFMRVDHVDQVQIPLEEGETGFKVRY